MRTNAALHIVLYGILIMVFSVASAQQQPQYSQYMYNMSAVNPAYVTDDLGVISMGMLYRSQWNGIQGGPQTANAFANIPISEKIELSINYINDRLGDAIAVQSHYANIDFAYITKLSNYTKLSYGIKAGIDSFGLNISESDVSSDPVFTQNSSQISPIVGAGIFLFTHSYYLGISSPNLISNSVGFEKITVSTAKLHLYLTTGYVFDFVDSVRLKPSLALKQVLDSPISFDLSMNALFYNVFELGVSYRHEDAVIGLASVRILPNLQLGYSYDFNVSPLKSFNAGTHEIMLLFNFDLLHLSKKYTSPRFY